MMWELLIGYELYADLDDGEIIGTILSMTKCFYWINIRYIQLYTSLIGGIMNNILRPSISESYDSKWRIQI